MDKNPLIKEPLTVGTGQYSHWCFIFHPSYGVLQDLELRSEVQNDFLAPLKEAYFLVKSDQVIINQCPDDDTLLYAFKQGLLSNCLSLYSYPFGNKEYTDYKTTLAPHPELQKKKLLRKTDYCSVPVTFF